MKETKTQKKGLAVLKSIVNTLINIMIVLVLITSILIAVMALTSKSNGISTVLGYTVQTIESDSMKGGSPDGYPEGDFGHGDLMIAKATNRDPNKVFQKGDIVTYSTLDTNGAEVFIVHRIVDVAEDASGVKSYQTQGDNREMSQAPDQLTKEEFLRADSFVSVYYTDGYKGVIINGVGGFLDYLRSQQGFFFVVLLPMIIFFMYELIRVVLNFANYKKTKSDEEKEEAVKAAVAAAKAESKLHDLPESLADMSPEQLEQLKLFMEMQKAQNAAEDSTVESADADSVEPSASNENDT